MIYIAHRGLIDGPNSELENRPDQVEHTLAQGFSAEVDLWWRDGWWLGHDGPQYAVRTSWLLQPNLWVHCKNPEAFTVLADIQEIVSFFHEADAVTLTTNRKLWTYPGNKIFHNSILVMPEAIDPTLEIVMKTPCYGICSDYVRKIKDMLEPYSDTEAD